MNMLPKKELEALHENDLRSMLKSLGLLSDLEAGKFHCDVCANTISSTNIGALISRSGTIVFVCSKLECLSKIAEG